jgi:hypothetical protein
VSVEHHLQGKGRMAAHLDGEVAPLSVDEVKVVMINLRPALAGLQVRHVTFTAVDFPHQRRCLGHENQKQTVEFRLPRQIGFGEPVLALCGGIAAILSSVAAFTPLLEGPKILQLLNSCNS